MLGCDFVTSLISKLNESKWKSVTRRERSAFVNHEVA